MTGIINLLTSFTGRISRRQWWIGFVIVCAGNLLGGLLLNPDFFLADVLPPPNWPDTLWQVAMLYPATAITVKRFNDRGWPWWLGYAFAPIGAVIYLAPHFGQALGPKAPAVLMVPFWTCAAYLIFAFVDNGFIRGTDGSNRYGPDPLLGQKPA